MFARSVNLRQEIVSQDVKPLCNPDDFVKEAKLKLQNVHKAAIKFIDKLKLRNKKYYDKTANQIRLEIGEDIHLQIE